MIVDETSGQCQSRVVNAQFNIDRGMHSGQTTPWAHSTATGNRSSVVGTFTMALSVSRLALAALLCATVCAEPMSPIFFGYNQGEKEAHTCSLTDQAFQAAINRQALGTYRYPAGTIANYWDWRHGTPPYGSLPRCNPGGRRDEAAPAGVVFGSLFAPWSGLGLARERRGGRTN